MNQGFAVAGAIANQLHHEGHWPPNNMNKVMGNDYHYDRNTITNFLVAVQWHLAHGNPPYYFQFDTNFAMRALTLAVGELIGAVNANTSANRPVGWVDL